MDQCDNESAVLQQTECNAEYCPTCNAKNTSYLCHKCRDCYICSNCAVRDVCKDCLIKCVICYSDAVCGDYLDCVCEECENKIEVIKGIIHDRDGGEYLTMMDLILSEKGGTVLPDSPIEEEIIEYLTEIGIQIEEHD